MATIASGNSINGLNGHIGNIVFYTLKGGTQVARVMPSKKKKKKLTPWQNYHISSFRAQHLFARSIKAKLINRIWSHLELKGGMNPYNQFIKSNQAAFGGSDHIMFPELLTISIGNLSPAEEFVIQRKGDTLKFTWNKNQGSRTASSYDQLNVALLVNRSSLTIVEVNATRGDGEFHLPVADLNAGVIEGFVFWSYNEKEFSPSVYWADKGKKEE